MKGAHWMDIRADFKKGLNFIEIGKKYGIGPRTVKYRLISGPYIRG
jgi:hypothetical protein